MTHVKSITNIKISLKFCGIDYSQILDLIKDLHYQIRANLISIYSNFTFVIFRTEKKVLHCNVTKLSNYSDILKAQKRFLEIFRGAKIINRQVDNICATRNVMKNIDFAKLFKKLNNTKENKFTVRYNNQKFPGMFIKFIKNYLTGTIIIFKSGKIILIGLKSPIDFIAVNEWILQNV